MSDIRVQIFTKHIDKSEKTKGESVKEMIEEQKSHAELYHLFRWYAQIAYRLK